MTQSPPGQRGADLLEQSQVVNQPISSRLDDNVAFVNHLIGIGTSWDIIAKPFTFGKLRMMSYVSNGFFLTMNMVLILEDVKRCIAQFEQNHTGQSFTIHELVDSLSTEVSFVQVQPVPTMKDAIRFILSGPLVFFIEGYEQALMIDTRIYPMRSITTPDLERTIRGARDAFTETMLMNTTLIRRRIRDPRLRDELMQIGTVSQTDVSLMYVEGVVDPNLVDEIRSRLKSVEVDGLFMGQQTLVEHLAQVGWNPYPIVRYTQRADVAATSLMEGQIVIVVDTSPDVIIAPTTMFHHLQHPQEYQSYPLFGTYMRWTILFGVVISVVLPGLFLLLNAHPDLMPQSLSFFKADRHDPLPLWSELIVAELGLDMLRLAIINSPKELASAVGIVAALLFGQFAAKIHLLQPEVLVYMGLVMIAQLAMTSYELGSANQLARYWLIGWTAFLGFWGFAISIVSWFVLLARTRSFGVPYLWPLIPFRWKHGMLEVLIRQPMQRVHNWPHMKLLAHRKTGGRS